MEELYKDKIAILELLVKSQDAEITRLKALAISERRKYYFTPQSGYQPSTAKCNQLLADFITEHKLS